METAANNTVHRCPKLELYMSETCLNKTQTPATSTGTAEAEKYGGNLLSGMKPSVSVHRWSQPTKMCVCACVCAGVKKHNQIKFDTIHWPLSHYSEAESRKRANTAVQPENTQRAQTHTPAICVCVCVCRLC